MVSWYCNKCRVYNQRLFGKKLCDACGWPMGKVFGPQEQEQGRPLVRSSSFATVPEPLPPLPSVVERVVESSVDDRCKLGAHSCKYCSESFLIGSKHDVAVKEVKKS